MALRTPAAPRSFSPLRWGGDTLDDELTMPGERVLSMHIIDQLLQCHQLKTTLL